MSLFTNAYGSFLGGSLPYFQAMPGIITPYGTLLKPGGRVAAYVRSTGAQDGEDHFASSGNLVTTLQQGLARCRSGQNDIVYVLPGHTENVAGADAFTNLVAGAQIIGVGTPGASNNPTFTWTATASSFLLDVADVTVAGLTMNWIGIDAVAAPLTVSARGCTVSGCTIICEDASSGALKGIVLGTGASNSKVLSNRFLSVGEAKPMTSAPILVSGAIDDVVIANNYISCANPGTAVLGHIAVTGVATNVQIVGNTCIQLETAGTALFTVTVGAVAATGHISYNNSLIGTDITTTTSGVSVNAAAAATMLIAENRTGDAATGRSAVLSPVVSA